MDPLLLLSFCAHTRTDKMCSLTLLLFGALSLEAGVQAEDPPVHFNTVAVRTWKISLVTEVLLRMMLFRLYPVGELQRALGVGCRIAQTFPLQGSSTHSAGIEGSGICSSKDT